MTTRNNALDQALDIAGSLTQTSNLTLLEESSSLGAPLVGQTGVAASITVGATVVITGLTGMTAASLGSFLTLSGGATPANNGTFLISLFVGATSVEIVNASAATDANNGSIIWTERGPYTLEDDINYIRTDRAAIKGVTFDAAIPTYVRVNALGTSVPADLSNIAGKTTDAKALVITRKIENQAVVSTDTFITLASAGDFQHADAVDSTGVPISDGFDAANESATYADIIDGVTEAALVVLAGGQAGERIYGVTRAGGATEPNEVELEFRSVAIGAPLSASNPYTWEVGQVGTIDVYYGFRNSLDAMDENALRTTLINGLVSDAGLSSDVTDIRSTIGIFDGDTDLNAYLTNTGDFFAFSDLPDVTPTVVEALNTLNTEIGDRTFTGSVIGDNDGYTITDILQNLADSIGGSTIVRTIERLVAPNLPGAPRTLPGGLSYTLDPTNNGNSIWIYWRGLLRNPGPVGDSNDYDETSATSFTPYSRIRTNDHINYFTGVA